LTHPWILVCVQLLVLTCVPPAAVPRTAPAPPAPALDHSVTLGSSAGECPQGRAGQRPGWQGAPSPGTHPHAPERPVRGRSSEEERGCKVKGPLKIRSDLAPWSMRHTHTYTHIPSPSPPLVPGHHRIPPLRSPPHSSTPPPFHPPLFPTTTSHTWSWWCLASSAFAVASLNSPCAASSWD
jgi:hypothetical protein